MTAQIPEKLLIGDLSLSMTTEPRFESSKEERYKHKNLEYYAYISQKEYENYLFSTALYRGSVNTWEIKNNRLFYAQRIPKEETQSNNRANYKFLFASSFSGVLRAWLGNELAYVHLGFLSKYEHDVFFSFSQGKLVSYWILHNSLAINCLPERNIKPLKLLNAEPGLYYCKYCHHLATSIGKLPSVTPYKIPFDIFSENICHHEWHKIYLDDDFILQCNTCGNVIVNTIQISHIVCQCQFNKTDNDYLGPLKLKKLFNPNLFINSNSKKFNFEIIKKYYV